MGKFALLVALNYVRNPEAALMGCVNDSHTMKELLLQKGFDEKNIKMVNDVDPNVLRPTGANVKMMLDWLCSNRKPTDTLFLAYSGHGTQVHDSTFSGDETDHYDEAIVLQDMFLLTDDDVKQFVSKLPKGCQFTAVMDCCHSYVRDGKQRGGLLDGQSVIIEGDKSGDSSVGNITTDGEEAKPRSLPTNILAALLSNKIGKPVEPTRAGINGGQATMFGGDASKLAMQFAAAQFHGGQKPGGNPVQALLQAATGAGQGAGSAGGISPTQMAMVAGIAGAVLGKMNSSRGSAAKSGDMGLAQILGVLGLGGMESATSAGAPPYRPTDGKLSEDVGILITGCASTETSADVRPKNGKPHGALTAALYEQWQKDTNVTNRELVLGVRKQLLANGNTQNPQLECSPAQADRVFLCSDTPKSVARAVKTEQRRTKATR